MITHACAGKPHQNDKPNLGPERHQAKGDPLEDTVRQNRMGEVGQEWASVESSLGMAGGHTAQRADLIKDKEKEREGDGGYLDRSPFGWLIGGATMAHTPDKATAVERDAGEM